jgi:hypothetical protein
MEELIAHLKINEFCQGFMKTHSSKASKPKKEMKVIAIQAILALKTQRGPMHLKDKTISAIIHS